MNVIFLFQSAASCEEAVVKKSDEKLKGLIDGHLSQIVKGNNEKINELISVAVKNYKKPTNEAEKSKIVEQVKTNLEASLTEFISKEILVFKDSIFQDLNGYRQTIIDEETEKIADAAEKDLCQEEKNSTEYYPEKIAEKILAQSKIEAKKLIPSLENQIRQKIEIVANQNTSDNPTANTISRANTNLAVEKNDSKANNDNSLTPIIAVFAVLFALVTASILAKKLYDKWKYGKNAARNLRGLKRAVSAKNDLTKKWLKKRKSANIHAIGVGKIVGSEDYCIQVFVEDANGEMLEDPPTQLLPSEYQNLPIVIYEMPRADFLTFSADEARQPHNILKGGISGANANLSGESGTIGYFFRPNFIDSAAHIFLKNHVYLLSNSHVFADLTKDTKDDSDLILQPSPGESAATKAVAELYDYTPIIFGGDVENPNFTDAAIAKLFGGQSRTAEIPRIGKITDFVRKEAVELRSKCQKFGRTTGYTSGEIFSIHLSIWVKYSAKGKEAFFKDQFLIIPEGGSSFVKSGDSGSLVVDDENRAVGLIFAGAGEKTALQFADIEQAIDLENVIANQTPRIENYGVANSISDVMKEFKIKLDI